MERIHCKVRCSFLELLVLAILINEGEIHGYALRKKIISATKERWNPSIGTIYRLLNNMLERGLVDKNAQGRKYVYSITRNGMKYFVKISKSILTRRVGALTELLRAYFAVAEESPDIIDKYLEKNLETLKKVLDSSQEILRKSARH